MSEIVKLKSIRKKSYHMETCQLICNANQLAGFYMIHVFTETYIQTDYSGFFDILKFHFISFQI